MATIEQLERALINADAAGDTEAARALAGEITKLRGAQSAPAAPRRTVMDDAPGFAKSAAKNVAGAVLEPVAAVGSGIVSAPVSGLAGLGSVLTNATGLTNTPPGDVVQKVGRAMTYSPRTEGGKMTTGAIAAPFEGIANVAGAAGQMALDETGSPVAATVVDAGLQSLPNLIGVRGVNRAAIKSRAKVQEAADRQSANSVRDQTLQEGREAGYVVPPSTVNPSFLNKRLESIAGKDAIKQEASIRNQEVTNKLVAQELGLPPGQPITEGQLSQLRNKLAEPYREVAAINSRAGMMLEQLKQARADANAYHRHYERSADPASQKKARDLDNKASSIESDIERIALENNKPDLVARLRDARRQIAKTYDVEKALNVGDASISAPVIGRMLDKGRPLTGNLKTVGNMAAAFRPYMRGGSMTPTPGVSALEPVLAAGGMAVGGPGGAFAAGLPLARGPIRNMMLSPTYQRWQATPRYSAGTLANLLARLPEGKQSIMDAFALSQQATGPTLADLVSEQ